MNKKIYHYDYQKHYSLAKINEYAYSFFATKILDNKEKFVIDLDNIISNISSCVSDNNEEITALRNRNHRNYYEIDIKFLKNVDERYKVKADPIISDYERISSLSLLKENEEQALMHQELIESIINRTNHLKDKMKDDLMAIINYVDEEEQKLDLTFLDDENLEANKLKKSYNALILHKSVLDLDNINLALKRQKDRLIFIRKLIPQTKSYLENRKKHFSSEYSLEDLAILKNNLSIMLSEYIFLLTHQEFHDVRKMYQGIMANDYSYVDEFLYVYKILMDKIWKYNLTSTDSYSFDFCYLVCDSDLSSNNITIGLMNRNNMDKYKDRGYICTYEGSLCDIFNFDKEELLNLRIPSDIKEKYLFNGNKVNSELVFIDTAYTKGNNTIKDTDFPTIEIR